MPKTPSQTRSVKPSRRDLRASLVLPVGITVLIWLAGLLVFTLAPAAQFNNVIAALIGGSLLVYLFFYTRTAGWRLRVVALLLATPALIGITVGTVNGRLQPTLIGVGVTFVLLVIQRALNVPLSYRAASRAFERGDDVEALRLLHKSIEARPDFAESYQLRALIRLLQLDFPRAEKDARQAIAMQPKSHVYRNTLGQIYLAQGEYARARDVYADAIAVYDGITMYLYQLGFCHYRLGDYRQAADALATATRKGLPAETYELLAHYYLGRSLEALQQKQMAQEAFAKMTKFTEAVDRLAAQFAQQPETPYTQQLRRDLDDLRGRLDA